MNTQEARVKICMGDMGNIWMLHMCYPVKIKVQVMESSCDCDNVFLAKVLLFKK